MRGTVPGLISGCAAIFWRWAFTLHIWRRTCLCSSLEWLWSCCLLTFCSPLSLFSEGESMNIAPGILTGLTRVNLEILDGKNEALGPENCPGKASQYGVYRETVARSLTVYSRVETMVKSYHSLRSVSLRAWVHVVGVETGDTTKKLLCSSFLTNPHERGTRTKGSRDSWLWKESLYPE